MEGLQKQKRIFSVDISCVLGIILMIGLHFFQKSGYEQQELSGLLSILPLALRWLCMAGVPLIVLVNGAAFSRDTFSFSQYRGLIKLVYCTAVCFAIVWIYSGGHPDSFSTSSVKPFYYYDGCDFALMYAVLLLLSPFLNCTYQALPGMRSKTVLIGIMVFLSSMPNILIFRGRYILPVELTQLWPVTLYFLGAYIWENRRKFDFLSYFVMMLSLCVSQAILSFSDSINSELHNFDSKRLNQYSSVNVIATAAVLFMMLCNMRTSKKSVRLSAETLASISLPILLISWIFEDNILGLLLGENQYGDMELMKCFLPFVLLTAAAAYMASAILMVPYRLVYSLFVHRKAYDGYGEKLAGEADESPREEYAEEEFPAQEPERVYVGRYERVHTPEEAAYTPPAEESFPVRRSIDDFSVDELLELITKK